MQSEETCGPAKRDDWMTFHKDLEPFRTAGEVLNSPSRGLGLIILTVRMSAAFSLDFGYYYRQLGIPTAFGN